ncbi:MAG: hypothetical protein OQK94_02030 [Gammaproteobacteria bacterium]|nr:hypothetical protein [Gammaproteobacteria bacterium]MCW8841330.1 hypothetical protein [Gammaproteobacteria bacterium]MCW8928017.1 hypothetical protein [Gammaproteobacteria bacterium]MCW8959422.1 hypothetical protein [Gammaproteobacteria bacterium]MCW8971966.1 hypothetical protein [Gammaproteobacteria bacterium]
MHKPVVFVSRQRGVSIIAAIFLLVALSTLGALMTVLLSSQSLQSATDLLSNQALYAAESAVQASAYRINQSQDCTAGDVTAQQLEAGLDAWYTISGSNDTINGHALCRIIATGMAGGSSGNPIAQRQITVLYGTAFLNYP